MGYFDTRKNVDEYIRLAEGFDGRELIERLRAHLAPSSSVLELGMGPGKDLDILAETFEATGSDASEIFVNDYREKHPDADVHVLDAVTIDISRTFDCVYSNKVLHHIPTADLERSLDRQREVLADGGIILHTFWRGEGSETMTDLLFVYYSESEIRQLLEGRFEPLAIERYTEMENDDSILVIARKL